jgi:hypothetical protein
MENIKEQKERIKIVGDYYLRTDFLNYILEKAPEDGGKTYRLLGYYPDTKRLSAAIKKRILIEEMTNEEISNNWLLERIMLVDEWFKKGIIE